MLKDDRYLFGSYVLHLSAAYVALFINVAVFAGNLATNYESNFIPVYTYIVYKTISILYDVIMQAEQIRKETKTNQQGVTNERYIHFTQQH